MPQDPRGALLAIFQSAVTAVNGRRAVSAWLLAHELPDAVYVIALGKAACAMAAGAQEVLGARVVRALVITKHGYSERLPWPVLEAGHPVPDAASLHAGARLLEFVHAIPPSAQVLVLLSGGASALAESLPPGVLLEDVQRLNQWLLSHGCAIDTMNAVRGRLSRIKGGRLAQQLAPRRVQVLAISDVAGDDPAVIGSGPCTPAGSATPMPETLPLPADLRALLARATPAPRADDGCFRVVTYDLVARPADALAAAVAAARARGLAARVLPPLAGDAAAAGASCAHQLLAAPAQEVLLWCGETTVVLPPHAGRGGRCQQLALSAAQVLDGAAGACLLAGATDGSDGPTEDAGALVDGATLARLRAEGRDAANALRGCDAGAALEASGDLLQTGPTGTNVMDLVLALRVE